MTDCLRAPGPLYTLPYQEVFDAIFTRENMEREASKQYGEIYTEIRQMETTGNIIDLYSCDISKNPYGEDSYAVMLLRCILDEQRQKRRQGRAFA